jgi:hypothetical protein
VNPREEKRALARLGTKEVEAIVLAAEVEVHGQEFRQAPEGVPICETAARDIIRRINKAAYDRGFEDANGTEMSELPPDDPEGE